MRRWRDRLRALRHQALTVWHVARDPRLPWPLRALAFAIAAYAFSPIDLIPDAIPVLGWVDDALIVPLGVLLVLRLAPRAVVADARARAMQDATRPVSRTTAALVVATWMLLSAGIAAWAWHAWAPA